MSSKSDLRAAVEEGVAIGVVAGLLDSSKTLLVLPKHLDQGGAVFVDSGAFGAFQKQEPVDWDRVFRAYEDILYSTANPGALSIVAPDVVGDQEGTLALWKQYAERVCSWIKAGVRVIVPLQRGVHSADVMLAYAKAIFETDQFCAGIPSNLEAMSASDCAKLLHHDFHVLGRVVLTKELTVKLQALLVNNPHAFYSADANWLRSRIREIAKATATARPNDRASLIDSTRTWAVRRVLQAEAYKDLTSQSVQKTQLAAYL
jgi:hypothetical protein